MDVSHQNMLIFIKSENRYF